MLAVPGAHRRLPGARAVHAAAAGRHRRSGGARRGAAVRHRAGLQARRRAGRGRHGLWHGERAEGGQDLRPGQFVGDGGQADRGCRRATARRSTCRPARPRCWSSPTTRRGPSSSRPTCWRRPSTARTRRWCWSRPRANSPWPASPRSSARWPSCRGARSPSARSPRAACCWSQTSTTALEVSNRYAPEHLILQVAEPRAWLGRVRNAGSVFLGAWTPETMGDYCSGTNHVLPTYGHARAYSGLGVADFVKRITVQEVTPAGLADLGRTARTLARLESLDAHANAVTRATRGHRTGVARMNPVLALARPDILELQPYQHAAWDPSLERMHANEMPWRAQGDNSAGGPQPLSGAAAARAGRADGHASTACRPRNVLVGRGSDEAIDLLVRAFCRAGEDSVVITPPTFGFYKVAARIQGAGVIEVPLLARRLRARRCRRCSRPAGAPRSCSSARPNNPTGNLLDEAAHARGLPRARRAGRWCASTRPTSSSRAARASPRGSPSSRTSWCCARCRRPMRSPARASAR